MKGRDRGNDEDSCKEDSHHFALGFFLMFFCEVNHHFTTGYRGSTRLFGSLFPRLIQLVKGQMALPSFRLFGSPGGFLRWAIEVQHCTNRF
jgi:hypothetical protein